MFRHANDRESDLGGAQLKFCRSAGSSPKGAPRSREQGDRGHMSPATIPAIGEVELQPRHRERQPRHGRLRSYGMDSSADSTIEEKMLWGERLRKVAARARASS